MKKSKKRVIPGFELTMGVTITMLSIVVLIPLASLVIYSSQLGFNEFIEVITRKRILSSFYVSFITALGGFFLYLGDGGFFCKCSDGADPGMGVGTL